MNNWQKQVAQFQTEVKGLELPTKPAIPAWDSLGLCIKLINEEYKETILALVGMDKSELGTPGNPKSLADIADGICDTIYVLLYTANMLGIDIEPCWNEVQRSNMTKLGGPKREDGKQLKGPNYQPPNLEAIIRWQQRDNHQWLTGYLESQQPVRIIGGFLEDTKRIVPVVGTIQKVGVESELDNYIPVVVCTGVDNYIEVGIGPFTTVELRDAQ